MNFTCFLVMYTLFLSNDLYANISAEYRNNGVIIQLSQAQTCFSSLFSVSDVNFHPGEGNALQSMSYNANDAVSGRLDMQNWGSLCFFFSFYASIFGRDNCYHIGIRNDWNSMAYKCLNSLTPDRIRGDCGTAPIIQQPNN